MSDIQAQTVEVLDFDAPDEPAPAPAVTPSEPPAEQAAQVHDEPTVEAEEQDQDQEEEEEESPRGYGRGRGRGRGGRGRRGRPRGEPYVPDTPQARERLTEDEMSAKFAAMRLQNEQLQAKRQAAIEDENQYSVLEEQTKAEQEAARKEQEALRQRTKEMQVQINAEREAAAARKLNKLAGREWDREKTEDEDYWNSAPSPPLPPTTTTAAFDAQDRPARGKPRANRGRGHGYNRKTSARQKPQPTRSSVDVADEAQFPGLNAGATAFEPRPKEAPSPQVQEEGVKEGEAAAAA